MRRKTLHPFWACWFTALLFWPMSVGFTLWVSSMTTKPEWYLVVSVIYVILYAIGLVVFGLAYVTDVPLLRERPMTAEEREREALDKEFPG